MENTETKSKNTDTVTDFLMRMGVLGELLTFFWRRKLYWLVPMIITLLLFGVIFAFASTPAGQLFIYTLF